MSAIGNSGAVLRNPPRKLYAPDGTVILDLTGASSSTAPTWGGGASKLEHAQKISAYPLVIGTDVPHDTAAGVGALPSTGTAAGDALTLSGLLTLEDALADGAGAVVIDFSTTPPTLKGAQLQSDGTLVAGLNADQLRGAVPGAGANNLLQVDSSGDIQFNGIEYFPGPGSGSDAPIHFAAFSPSGQIPNGIGLALLQAVSGFSGVGVIGTGLAVISGTAPAFSVDGGSGGLTNVGGQSTSGPLGVPAIIAREIEKELTSTSATQIFSVTPHQNGQFRLNLSVRVATAATTVSATLTFTDAGGAETYDAIASQSLSVGTHGFPIYPFPATTGGAIALSVTAGTANTVYVTSVLEAM